MSDIKPLSESTKKALYDALVTHGVRKKRRPEAYWTSATAFSDPVYSGRGWNVFVDDENNLLYYRDDDEQRQ